MLYIGRQVSWIVVACATFILGFFSAVLYQAPVAPLSRRDNQNFEDFTKTQCSNIPPETTAQARDIFAPPSSKETEMSDSTEVYKLFSNYFDQTTMRTPSGIRLQLALARSDEGERLYSKADMDQIIRAMYAVERNLASHRLWSGGRFADHLLGSASCAIHNRMRPEQVAATLAHGMYLQRWDYDTKPNTVCEERRVLRKMVGVTTEQQLWLSTLAMATGPWSTCVLLWNASLEYDIPDDRMTQLLGSILCDDVDEGLHMDLWFSNNWKRTSPDVELAQENIGKRYWPALAALLHVAKLRKSALFGDRSNVEHLNFAPKGRKALQDNLTFKSNNTGLIQAIVDVQDISVERLAEAGPANSARCNKEVCDCIAYQRALCDKHAVYLQTPMHEKYVRSYMKEFYSSLDTISSFSIEDVCAGTTARFC